MADGKDPRRREAGLNYLAANTTSPTLYGLPHLAGTIHGLVSDDAPTSGGMSIVPGVGVSRFLRQRRELSKRLGAGEYRRTLAEHFGPMTAALASLLAGAGVGAGIGWLKGRKGYTEEEKGEIAEADRADEADRKYYMETFGRDLSCSNRGEAVRNWYSPKAKLLKGLGVGALSGGLLAALASCAAGIGAASTKTRDSKAQRDYEHSATNGNLVANYLVPGLARYNKYKTVGHMLNSDDYLKG